MDGASDARSSVSAMRDGRALLVFFAVAAMVLAADLFLKEWSFAHVAGVPVVLHHAGATGPEIVPQHDAMVVVSKVLSLRLTVNRGAVFGLGAGGRPFFIAMTLIALVVILTMFSRSPRGARLLHVTLALILAGALGNLYDRIVFGAVRDMLYLFPGVNLPFGWHWPGGSAELYPWIFNIADVSLVVGIALLMIRILTTPQHPRSTR
jgi:signal peptidase II